MPLLDKNRSLQSELNGYNNQIEKLKSDIGAAETEIGQLSMLQLGRKSELQKTVKLLKEEKNRIETQMVECQNKLNTIGDIIDPVNESIEQFSANLCRIVEKYRYTV